MASLSLVQICLTCLLVIGYLGSATGEIPAESSSAVTSSECYDDNLAPVCPTGSQIAITSYHDGFKAVSLNCPVDGTATGTCCSYDASGDCLQEAPTESRYVDAFSGRDSGVISTSSVLPTSGGDCDSASYSPVSVFSQIKYLCIPVSRSLEMCASGTQTNAQPVYIQNRGYSSGNSIVSSDTSCNCSVENSAFTDIIMYVIHMDLYDVTDCKQNFTISNGGGTILRSYDCADLDFSKITNESLTGPYLVLTLLNSYITNGGKFWVGFQAAMTGEDLTVNCPAIDQQHHLGCSTLSDTSTTTVSVSTTAYNGVATYACKAGYVISSGDVTRICQANNNWNGSELICIFDCGSLQNPANGAVNAPSTTSNAVATYSCDANYTLDGVASRTCVDSTGWSGSEPQCLKDCSQLSDTSTSTVSVSTTAYNGVATYACKTGYVISSGDITRICQANGNWNGSELICAFDCDSLQNPANGVVNVPSTSSNAVATYSCDANYTLVGVVSRTCVEPTGWNGSEPQCLKGCSDDSECDVNYSCDTANNVCQKDQDPDNSKSGLQTIEIVGIVLSCVVIMAAIGAIVLNRKKIKQCCCKRCSNEVAHDDGRGQPNTEDHKDGTSTTKKQSEHNSEENANSTTKRQTEHNAEGNGTPTKDSQTETHTGDNKKGPDKLRAHQSVHAEMDKLQLF